ncbi:MAG TPA: HAMP domain-containing sensor histidine kinase [Actinomycetota bacterium]
MERSLSYIRALVIITNVTTFLLLPRADRTRPAIAFTVIVIALLYAVWSVFERPYERYPLLHFGWFTLAVDAGLISLWVYGTGGWQSEYWVIYFISVISVAMRWDLRPTILAATAEAGLLLGVYAVDRARFALGMVVRPSYIVICGIAAGLLARQERIHREESAVMTRIAFDHAEKLERERELSEMKSQFVSNAAHELRTPLTSLAGLAQLLARRKGNMTPVDVERALESMDRQGARASKLINDLLDFSRLEVGATVFERRPVPLRAAVDSAIETVGIADGTPIDNEIPPDVRATADPARLEEVLVNLIANASKYGGSRVDVRAERLGDGVRLIVADDGEGVPEEFVPVLFEPFTRADGHRDTIGSGLGLAISRRSVEGMAGTLRYEPNEPNGARFIVELPAAD